LLLHTEGVHIPCGYTLSHYTDLQDLDGSSYRRPSFSSVGHHGDVPVKYYMRLCRWREERLARHAWAWHATSEGERLTSSECTAIRIPWRFFHATRAADIVVQDQDTTAWPGKITSITSCSACIEKAPLATSPGCRKGETLCMDDDADEHASFPSGSPRQTPVRLRVLACFFRRGRQLRARPAGWESLRVRAYIYLAEIGGNRSCTYIHTYASHAVLASVRLACDDAYV
jgi:hypothetical protein